MYILPFNHPDHPVHKGDDCWKFFIICEDREGEQSDFLDAMESVGPEFDDALRHVSKLATTGLPWKSLIPDARRFHDVGKVKLKRGSGKHETETVWSFKHGNVRILWCYAGPKKVILFGQTFFKDQRKLAEADIKIVQREMQRYITALDTGHILIAGGKENESTFGSLFSAE